MCQDLYEQIKMFGHMIWFINYVTSVKINHMARSEYVAMQTRAVKRTRHFCATGCYGNVAREVVNNKNNTSTMTRASLFNKVSQK